MKKLLAALAAICICAAPIASRAGQITSLAGLADAPVQIALNRTSHYTGMNPPSQFFLWQQRWERLGLGAFWWNAFCGSNTTCAGTYSNLAILPVTTMNVAVGPVNSSTVGSLYQFLADDTSPWGGYPAGVGNYLAADATQIMLQGTATTNGPNIALAAPIASGTSVDDLIECQVRTVDATSTSVNIVSSGGSVTSTNVNRDRNDTIYCQSKAGTAATTGTQTAPSVDGGWVSVGYVAIPYGTTTITSGMVVAATQFGGFAPLNANGSVNVSGMNFTASPGGYIDFGNTNASAFSLIAAAGSTTYRDLYAGGYHGTTGTFSGAVSAGGTVGGNILTSTTYLQAQDGLVYFNAAGSQYIQNSSGTFGFTGPINATGYSGGPISGTTGTFSGAVTGTGGTFSGNIVADSGSGGQMVMLTDGTNPYFRGGGTYYFQTAGGATYAPIYVGSITSVNDMTAGANLVFNESGPAVAYNPYNYLSLYGTNATTGVDIGNNNSSGTNIATFNTVGSNVSYVLRSGAYSNPSDRRLKKNINYHPGYGLTSIMNLHPVTFDWRDNRTNGKHDIGFIAQDVQKIPALAPLVAKPSKFYGLDYAKFVPVLVKAIQEQQAEIKHLQSALAKLRL